MVVSGLDFSSEVHVQYLALDMPGTSLSCFLPWLQREEDKHHSTKVEGQCSAEMLLIIQKVSVFVTARWSKVSLCIYMWL